MKKTIFLNSIFIFSLFIIGSCNFGSNSKNDETTEEEIVNNTGEEIIVNNAEDVNSDVTNTKEFHVTDEAANFVSEPYDIKDYFLLLPNKLILNIPLSDRKKILEIKDFQASHEAGIYYLTKIIDIKNAFIRICSTGDGGGNNIEMTYFIKSDKTKLIAVNISSWDMLTESSDVHFYTVENNIWTDVTTDVIPEINMSCFSKATTNVDNAAILVILPQKGKTIKAVLDIEALTDLADYDNAYLKVKEQLFCTKYDLAWNDGTFIIKNKIME